MNPAYNLSLQVAHVDAIQGDIFEDNNSNSTATELNPSFWAPGQLANSWHATLLSLSIHEDFDEDWFCFDVDGPSNVSVLLSAGAGLELELYDISLARAVVMNSTVNASTPTTSVELATTDWSSRSPGPQRFCALVWALGAVEEPIAYNITLQKVGITVTPSPVVLPDALEDNNTPDTATEWLSPTFYSDTGPNDGPELRYIIGGLTIHEGDVDVFCFRANATDTIQAVVSFENADGDLDVELIDKQDPSNVILLSRTHNDGEEVYLPAGDSTPASACVRVYGFDGAVNGNYSVSVVLSGPPLPVAPAPTPNPNVTLDALEPNGGPLTATEIDVLEGAATASWQGLSIHSWDDEDWFCFTTVTTSQIQIEINFQSRNASGDLDLLLRQQTGPGELDFNLTAVSDDLSPALDSSESVNVTDAIAGMYCAQVLGFRGATNEDYSFSAIITPVAPIPPTPAPTRKL